MKLRRKIMIGNLVLSLQGNEPLNYKEIDGFPNSPTCIKHSFDPLIVAWWHHMATEIWVNIVSGNGLLPGGTKPLPEPMLIYH